MSDYLGPKQTRVLDSDNRSFEEIVYQKKKPPLACEWNLGGKLSSDVNRGISNFLNPSGWSIIGNIKDSVIESSCIAGDVVTSPSYVANTLRFIALDKGISTGALTAWVDGYKLLIQGSNSADENNTIILTAPPSIGTRVDFVFLEVWRKLILPTDVVYKYGNVLYGGINPANDLIDPAINLETSLRIQVQYRIRVAECDIESYPDGFDPNKVFVQGPLPNPINTCSHAFFSPVPGDIGLWRAGVGDTAAQETLQTVDGYTYAIPMFAIHRRNTGAYEVINRSNGSNRSLADYNNGIASDRPDNLYNNWIVGTDILDMRHKISPVENMKELAEDAFKKLIKGNIHGKMVKQTIGEDHFGTILVQVDAISNVDLGGSNKIGQGDSISATATSGIPRSLRRNFSNADIIQKESIVIRTTSDKTFPAPGGAWAINDRVEINIQSYPTGTMITSVEEIYCPGVTVTLSSLPTNLLTITIASASIGNTNPLKIECTIAFVSGAGSSNYGFINVPEVMLEVRDESPTITEQIPYALIDNDIRLRTSNPVVTTDGTKFNILSNRGGNITEPYNFGHQMTYHMLGTGTTAAYQIPMTINGYQIIGVISAKVDGTYRTIGSVDRNIVPGYYRVSVGGSAIDLGKDVEFQLYTATKFFETNKQGRAIIETYEMAELKPYTGSGLDFYIDSTNQSILAIASTALSNGNGIAYVNGVQTVLNTNNAGLPTDTTKSIIHIQFNSAPVGGSLIEVPLLMRSSIGPNEGYTFFYHTVPYQGLLDSSATGHIESVGPSIITTSGSGLITNYTYTDGKALFLDTTVVRGIGTQWLSNVKAGYTIHSNSEPDNEYIISEVFADDTLFITAGTDMSSAPAGNTYTITSVDQPYFNYRNIIDRLPALDTNNDASGNSDVISTLISEAYPILETRIISNVQDISDLPMNSFWIGQNTAERGRSTINVNGILGLGNLGIKFEKLSTFSAYQKTYQTYIMNKDNDGHLYLMVVGSETDNTSAYKFMSERSTLDSVDIFQLPGRPITMRRLA